MSPCEESCRVSTDDELFKELVCVYLLELVASSCAHDVHAISRAYDESEIVKAKHSFWNVFLWKFEVWNLFTQMIDRVVNRNQLFIIIALKSKQVWILPMILIGIIENLLVWKTFYFRNFKWSIKEDGIFTSLIRLSADSPSWSFANFEINSAL